MATFTCTICQQPLGDTTMSLPDLNNEIWEHFYQSHKENKDPNLFFGAYIEMED
jgi:hypothetical protein